MLLLKFVFVEFMMDRRVIREKGVIFFGLDEEFV